MATTTKRKTVDALEIIDDRYFRGRPEMEALLAEAEERLRLAERLRELREQRQMSQEEVANRAGTKRSVIARLEKPGYQKHTLTTLKKVAGAMGYAVKVEFVPVQQTEKAKGLSGRITGKKQPRRTNRKASAPAKAAASKSKAKKS